MNYHQGQFTARQYCESILLVVAGKFFSVRQLIYGETEDDVYSTVPGTKYGYSNIINYYGIIRPRTWVPGYPWYPVTLKGMHSSTSN